MGQQTLSWTKELAANQNKQQNEKKYNDEFEEMNVLKIKINLMDAENARIVKSKQYNAKRDEMKKEINSLSKEQNILIASCKDMEVHINDIKSEYDDYGQSMNGLEDKLIKKYENEQNEKDKLYDYNLQKAIQQHQSLKNE